MSCFCFVLFQACSYTYSAPCTCECFGLCGCVWTCQGWYFI